MKMLDSVLGAVFDADVALFNLKRSIGAIYSGILRLGKASKTYPSRESGGWGDIRFL